MVWFTDCSLKFATGFMISLLLLWKPWTLEVEDSCHSPPPAPLQMTFLNTTYEQKYTGKALRLLVYVSSWFFIRFELFPLTQSQFHQRRVVEAGVVVGGGGGWFSLFITVNRVSFVRRAWRVKNWKLFIYGHARCTKRKGDYSYNSFQRESKVKR